MCISVEGCYFSSFLRRYATIRNALNVIYEQCMTAHSKISVILDSLIILGHWGNCQRCDVAVRNRVSKILELPARFVYYVGEKFPEISILTPNPSLSCLLTQLYTSRGDNLLA